MCVIMIAVTQMMVTMQNSPHQSISGSFLSVIVNPPVPSFSIVVVKCYVNKLDIV